MKLSRRNQPCEAQRIGLTELQIREGRRGEWQRDEQRYRMTGRQRGKEKSLLPWSHSGLYSPITPTLTAISPSTIVADGALTNMHLLVIPQQAGNALMDTHMLRGFYFQGIFWGFLQFFTKSASILLQSTSTRTRTRTRTHPMSDLNSPPRDQTNSSIHTNKAALSERAGMAPGWTEHGGVCLNDALLMMIDWYARWATATLQRCNPCRVRAG